MSCRTFHDYRTFDKNLILQPAVKKMRLWEKLLCFKKTKVNKVEKEALRLAKARKQKRKMAKYAKQVIHQELARAIPDVYAALIEGGLANVVICHDVDPSGSHFIRFHTSTVLPDQDDVLPKEDDIDTEDDENSGEVVFEDLEDHGAPSNDFEDLEDHGETQDIPEVQLSPDLLAEK